MMNMKNRVAENIILKLKEKKTRWDFLSTFHPPNELSFENGNIFKIEQMPENSPDYEFIAKQFLETFGGIKALP